MRGLEKDDVILCPGCGLALAQATDDIPLGLMHWWNRLRPLSLPRMPAPGTPLNEITCPKCTAQWYPTFAVARKE